MTEPGPGPARRRLPLPLLAAVVMAVALAIGIPVGLVAGAERDSSELPTPYPSVEPLPSVEPTTSEPPTDEPTVEPTDDPTDEPTTSSAPAGPPGGLTSAQEELWYRMEMKGVHHQSCAGYPEGERLAGVVAALACEIEDTSFEEPIIYYQFGSAAAVATYLTMRARDIDRTGACSSGYEGKGEWEYRDTAVGRYVCVDNAKNGRTYFKMVFSTDGDQRAVVVQGESAAEVYAWFQEYADGQFYGVGDN